MKTETSHRKQTATSAVWFEVPAENVRRASSFYALLFGAEIGDILSEPIVNYVPHLSVHDLAARVEDLGGEICLLKRAALQLGYFVICRDSEGQVFRLWQTHDTANVAAKTVPAMS
jgi:uncharacterized protein